MRACMCVCVCVCEREREREGEYSVCVCERERERSHRVRGVQKVPPCRVALEHICGAGFLLKETGVINTNTEQDLINTHTLVPTGSSR